MAAHFSATVMFDRHLFIFTRRPFSGTLCITPWQAEPRKNNFAEFFVV
jgi:hypothetical protein